MNGSDEDLFCTLAVTFAEQKYAFFFRASGLTEDLEYSAQESAIEIIGTMKERDAVDAHRCLVKEELGIEATDDELSAYEYIREKLTEIDDEYPGVITEVYALPRDQELYVCLSEQAHGVAETLEDAEKQVLLYDLLTNKMGLVRYNLDSYRVKTGSGPAGQALLVPTEILNDFDKQEYLNPSVEVIDDIYYDEIQCIGRKQLLQKYTEFHVTGHDSDGLQCKTIIPTEILKNRMSKEPRPGVAPIEHLRWDEIIKIVSNWAEKRGKFENIESIQGVL